MIRYPTTREVVSNQDPLADVLDWLGFLAARDYLSELLTQRHGLSPAAASSRVNAIVPHVRTGREYVQQSLDGPPALSFLPAYYAMLNLMKVYVLLGPRHGDLQQHRWHGITYDVSQNRRSILTEEITIRTGGVSPLFYESLTGLPFGSRQRALRMRELLPYVAGVTHEYELATGEASRLAVLKLTFEQRAGGLYPIMTAVAQPNAPPPQTWRRSELRLLRGFRADPNQPGRFVGTKIANEANRVAEARAQLRTHLAYRYPRDVVVTPLSASRLELPEELPIALLFFHMSSVVRYRPEFFDRLQDSRFWPFLTSARIHSFYSFLLAFWSFMQQQNYFVYGPSRS